jgi:hypothetical protein
LLKALAGQMVAAQQAVAQWERMFLAFATHLFLWLLPQTWA